MRSLNTLQWLQKLVVRVRLFWFNRIWGMSIHPTVRMSMTAKFDKTYPRGMHIDAESYVAFGAAILTHDRTRAIYRNTYIGKRCFIGANSMIMPGVKVGDSCVVAAGAIVTKDVPAGSVVAGNPAKIIREGIVTGPYGRLVPEGQKVSIE
jgi:acetyltransferase-like isoleucine patch superfamily enzyme